MQAPVTSLVSEYPLKITSLFRRGGNALRHAESLKLIIHPQIASQTFTLTEFTPGSAFFVIFRMFYALTLQI